MRILCAYPSHPRRLVRHIQVQHGAGVRVRARHVFVQLHTQAGRGGRDDVAVFPLDGLFQNLAVKTFPVQDAFLDQEVGAASGQLDICCAHHRAAVQVRSDLHMAGFGHGGDFLPSKMPPTRPRFICKIAAAPSSNTR